MPRYFCDFILLPIQVDAEAEEGGGAKTAAKRKAEKKIVIRDLTKEEQKVVAAVLKAGEGSKKLLGAHVSAEKGLQNAVINAASIGCRSFAFFCGSPRKFKSPPLDDRTANAFVEACKVNSGGVLI